jgi:hypothetical protein
MDPDDNCISTSMVGFPRESSISRACTSVMIVMAFSLSVMFWKAGCPVTHQ